ncbi:ATPase, T2SS/T4P/T4SS family [Providencia huaxiensis]
MCSSLLSSLQDYLNQPQGLILVTGPTGSGKTVTLYSALEYLNKSSRNIFNHRRPNSRRSLYKGSIKLKSMKNIILASLLL